MSITIRTCPKCHQGIFAPCGFQTGKGNDTWEKQMWMCRNPLCSYEEAIPIPKEQSDEQWEKLDRLDRTMARKRT